MKKYGVVFDFNGTLFWDTDYQNSSWDEYLLLHNSFLTLEEKAEYIHGRNSKDTFEYIFKRKLSMKEVEQLTEEKEVLYRKECERNTMKLAPGVEGLLKKLKSRNTKIAIATAAGKINVDFFIKKFELLKYFKQENIIYNDGTIRGKPHPDLFNKAIAAIQVPKENIIIFEDSKAGIEAAKRSKVKNIVIVNSCKTNYSMYNYPQITHFDQFDLNLLLNG